MAQVGEAGSGEPGAWGALRARSNDVDLILELPYGPAAIDKAATEAEHMAAPDHAQHPAPKIRLASGGASTHGHAVFWREAAGRGCASCWS